MKPRSWRRLTATFVQSVSDFRANSNDQIAYAARVIGTGQRRRVFEAIYRGKRQIKTVGDLMAACNLTRKQVLTAGLVLAKTELVDQINHDGETAYRKQANISHFRDKICALADDPARLGRLPTKVSPRVTVESVVHVEFPKALVKVEQLTVDDLDSFEAVVSQQVGPASKVSESCFKKGVQSILGEVGVFKDWGGELNDLCTTRVVLRGNRVPAVFAFKGPGKKGILKPSGMGKNGDQLQKLFQTPARLYVLQYWNQVDQQVYADMRAFAVNRAVADGEEIAWVVIDGADSSRIIAAYPDHFECNDAEGREH